jgi:large subunit ribosomal protein L21
MYAVIQTGGKQYRVAPGDFLEIEKLPGEIGNLVQFDQILMIKSSDQTSTPEANNQIHLGKPFLEGAQVHAEVVSQGRGKKVLIVKMKRRKQYRRTKGHRQELTQVLITSISGAGVNMALPEDQKQSLLKTVFSNLKQTVKNEQSENEQSEIEASDGT